MQVNYCYATKGDNTITINCDVELAKKIISILEDEAFELINDNDFDGCKNLLDVRESILAKVKEIDETDGVDSDY